MSSPSFAGLPTRLPTLAEIDAELARRSLAEFVRQAWPIVEPGVALAWNWHLDVICEALERQMRGEEAFKRLLICVPPGTMKSLLVSVFAPAWQWLESPERRKLFLANDDDLGIRDSRRTRDIITSEWYQGVLDYVARVNGTKPWTLSHDQNEKVNFANTQHGFRQCRSIGSKITGKRADCIARGQFVTTINGLVPIEDVGPGDIVLTHRGRWRKVVATLAHGRQKVVRLWAGNAALVCTREHRLLTPEGWCEAEESRVVYRTEVRKLRQEIRSQRPMAFEASHTEVLLASMQGDVLQRCIQGGETQLYELRNENSRKAERQEACPKVLFDGMQESSRGKNGIHEAVEQAAVSCVSSLVQTIKLQDEILFNGVQEYGTQYRHVRQVQPKFQKRRLVEMPHEEIQEKNIEGDAPGRLLCRMWNNNETACASSRREQKKRPPGKSHRTVSPVPYRVALVEEYGEADVYDLQVEEDHSFVAAGFIVHNCIVIDDPIDAKEVVNGSVDQIRKRLEEVGNVIDKVLPSRVNDLREARWTVIMQRLHEEDTAGRAIKEGGWHLINLQMEFEPGNPLNHPDDPRTEAGELLFPERFPRVEVEKLKKKLDRDYAAQYQQNPLPKEGGVLKRWYWCFWYPEEMQRAPAPVVVRLPNGDLHTCRQKALPHKLHSYTQSWDMAFKDSKDSAFVVGQVWAESGPDGFLVDQVRDKMDINATLDAVRALSKRWPQSITKLVEDKANGPAVVGMLKRELPGFIEIEPDGGKEARCNAAAPICRAGNVWLPHPALFPWVKDLIAEAEAAPFGSYMDQVDSLTQYVNYRCNSDVSRAIRMVTM